jgi:hypothetical protein
MRLQIHIIALLSSLLLWGLALNGARDALHLARRHGLTPHAGIEHSIKSVFRSV